MTDLSHFDRAVAPVAGSPDPAARSATGAPALPAPAGRADADAAGLPRLPGLPYSADPPAIADADPQETAEWLDSLDAVLQTGGPQRARYLLDALQRHASRSGLGWRPALTSPFVNTIAVSAQPRFPGELELERELAAIMRWNALAMVVRANRAHGELGGHIASYASAADLFEVGFNHFFRARCGAFLGDLV